MNSNVKKENTSEESNSKKVFAARVFAWALFSCAAPVCFIGWRYDLFKEAGSLQLSGWGLFGVVIIVAFLYTVIKYIQAGFSEWSMTKQIINGVLKILLPIAAVLAVCIGIRSQLDYFIQSLCCVLICEAAAIPINPFPKWVYEKSKGRFESTVDFIADRFNKKKED